MISHIIIDFDIAVIGRGIPRFWVVIDVECWTIWCIFFFSMQKTNPGRVWASGEGAEIVCCRWKSRAGHRGSESLQVTWISEEYYFPFISPTEENSFKCLFFLLYRQRIQDMEEELQKTERSYKNQVNLLLAGYCVIFYCIIPVLCGELLEILVAG